jgi:hypothetical protein
LSLSAKGKGSVPAGEPETPSRRLPTWTSPLEGIRELYFEAEELLKKKRLDLFLEQIREKVQRGTAGQRELKEIEEWLRNADGEEFEKALKCKGGVGKGA